MISYKFTAKRGRSHLLIRKSKGLNQLLDQREESKDGDLNESIKDSQIIDLKDEIINLKRELESKEKRLDHSDKYADLLNDLFHKGIIDENGDFLEKEENISS